MKIEMNIEQNKENAEKLAKNIVSTWDEVELLNYAIAKLTTFYNNPNAKTNFEDDWKEYHAKI